MKKPMKNLWATLNALIVPPSQKNDDGAGFVEYVAIVILVAAIAVAIYSLGLVSNISGSIGENIDAVLNTDPG
ncbi:hypothetical protein SUDANB121_01872 [Nocardiopsis dassonvillei]|uniref:hypothetical protein n=1 Tax=Nocardiopsis dassonvillei TaxID=2014 RepID=UPI003F5749B4